MEFREKAAIDNEDAPLKSPDPVSPLETVGLLDVVIVGAGLSGLAAAHKLLSTDPDLKIAVVEAKDRVGGRTFGQKLVSASGDDIWDLGGQWVGSCQPHIMKLLEELKMETFEQFTKGKKIIGFSDGRLIQYDSEIPSLPLLSLIDLHLFMRKIESMREKVNSSNPALCKDASHWDAMTVEDFAQRHLWTKSAKETIDCVLRCIFGSDAVHMSMLYFLTYLSAAGGLEPIISAKKAFGGQELKIKGGAWQVCKKLAEKLPRGVLKLSSPVKSIEQEIDSVVVSTMSGVKLTAKRVILAVPPHLIGQIVFVPNLPLEKRHVYQRMPVGYLTKVIVTYKTAFWRDSGLSGEVATIGGKSIISECDSGPLCIVFDATTSNDNPAILSFIGGTQQLQYSHLSAIDRRRAVLHSLSQFFGLQALSPLDYCEKNWNEEPYNGGCPVSVGTPGMMTYFASALRKPFGCVHFAGTESATCWSGFLNGAVQSGYRAANEVLYNLRPQTMTANDLEDTAYDFSQMSNPVAGQTSSVVLHLAVGLGIIGITIFFFYRYRHQDKNF